MDYLINPMSPQSMLKHVFSRKMALLRSITSDLESTINRIFQLAAATQPLQVLQTMQRRTGYGLQICIVPNILRDTVEIVRANDMLTSPILLHEGYKFDPADSAYVFPRPLDFILRMDDFEGFKDASQFVLSEPGKQWVLYAAQKIDVYLQNLLDSFGNIRSDGNPASLRHILDSYRKLKKLVEEMPTVIDLTTGLEHPRNCLLCSCDRSNDRRRAVPLYCKVCKTLVCTECMMDEPVRNYSDVDSVMVTCKDCGGGKKTKIYSSSSSSSSGDSPEGDESYDMEIESE